jgi:hypothetical protein
VVVLPQGREAACFAPPLNDERSSFCGDSFTLFLIYPAASSATFRFFMLERFDEAGEDGLCVMRADRSVHCASAGYVAGRAYAVLMLLVYPVGVPALYLCLLYRSRCELRELRRIELTMETDHRFAKLRAAGADSDEQGMAIMFRAEADHDASRAAYEELRDALPTTLRKLTAGYEMRTYWFEVFECVRKIALVGLPVFFEPGAPSQLICTCTCARPIQPRPLRASHIHTRALLTLTLILTRSVHMHNMHVVVVVVVCVDQSGWSSASSHMGSTACASLTLITVPSADITHRLGVDGRRSAAHVEREPGAPRR